MNNNHNNSNNNNNTEQSLTSPSFSCAVNRHSDNTAYWSHITVHLLGSWLNELQEEHRQITSINNKKRVIFIIDSRDASEFNFKHIRNAININDSPWLRKQLVTDKLSINELLIKKTIALSFDPTNLNTNEHLNIIVYDQKSEHTNQLDAENEFSILLLKKLAQKFRNVSFLSGGFETFCEQFPLFCKNSRILGQENCSNAFDLNSFKLKKHSKLSYSLSSYAFDRSQLSAASRQTTETQQSPPTASVSLDSPSAQAAKEPRVESPFEALRQPTKILDFLYLGSEEDACCHATMNSLDITHVLNVSVQCKKPPFILDSNFLRIPINDGPSDKILPFFDTAYNFIEKCRIENKKCLVHCFGGISRSPTLAIAYLMRFRHWKSDEAYKYVKERRHSISPNFNFLGQLYEYEKQQHQQHSSSLKTIRSESNLEAENVEKQSSLDFLKLGKKPLGLAAQAPIKQSDVLCMQQRKKQFVFDFSGQTNSSLNQSLLVQSPIQPTKMLNLNSSSLQLPLSLQSPSQALSNFNLNSPTKADTNHQPANQTTMNPRAAFTISKSFTFDSIKTSSQSGGVIIRRPTHLLLTPDSSSSSAASQQIQMPSNSLKRPSSILLNSFNSPQKSKSKEEENELEDLNFGRQFSNLSNASVTSSTSSSSCCSCSSSSYLTNNCTSCLLVSANSNQKKLKLSPIHDTQTKLAEPFNSLDFSFENSAKILCKAKSQSSKDLHKLGVDCSTNKASGAPLTPTSVLNADNLMLCFGQNLNESKSFENLNKPSLAIDANDENIENEQKNSTQSLNSLLKENISKKSSSGSSKSNSNKNSLHGSVETMIHAL